MAESVRWVVHVPLQDDRWFELASCTTVEAVAAIVTAIMTVDSKGPLVCKVERRREFTPDQSQ